MNAPIAEALKSLQMIFLIINLSMVAIMLDHPVLTTSAPNGATLLWRRLCPSILRIDFQVPFDVRGLKQCAPNDYRLFDYLISYSNSNSCFNLYHLFLNFAPVNKEENYNAI